MICPICQKRKAKRLCPARAESICAICCGTEREVTIDCPSDCVYLAASREYDAARQAVDWSQVPFAKVKIPPSFARDHGPLVAELNYAVSKFASEHREVVDADALAALQALAETYRTLTSGIYYEQPPVNSLQHAIYETLKAAIEEFKKVEARRPVVATTRDSDIRDALILLTQLGASRTNGRPKGRAYLDLLRAQFAEEEFRKSSSNIVLLS